MTAKERQVLEDYTSIPHYTPETIQLSHAISSALQEIDTLNPPMPIDQYSPEQRRRHAEQNRRANEAFFYGMQE